MHSNEATLILKLVFGCGLRIERKYMMQICEQFVEENQVFQYDIDTKKSVRVGSKMFVI